MSDLAGTRGLASLFMQLGLPSDKAGIENFIRTHQGLSQAIHLWDAPFWNPIQSEFLRRAFEEDAEWARAFDELNAKLR